MIVVNFKRYPEASGENAVNLTKICAEVSKEYAIPIIACPDSGDLRLCKDFGIECWTQKYESQVESQTGTLLNHSDFRLTHDQLQEEFYLSRSRGDKICICTESLEETIEFLKLRPDYLAYEPRELIGSKTTSVAEAEPEIIGKAAHACRQAGIPFLAGAGIKSGKDVQISLQQGAIGVILASAVVFADNPKAKLIELAKSFK